MQEPTDRRSWLARLGAFTVAGLAGSRISLDSLLPPDATPLDRALAAVEPTPAPTGVIRLDRNENPNGPSARAREAMRASILEPHRYPLETRQELVALVASHHGVPVDHVLLGAGSTEPLGLLATLHFRDGAGSVVSADRTFGVLQRYAERLGARWIRVSLTPELATDAAALERGLARDTRVVYICNPNNPTGVPMAPGMLEDACRELGKRALVVVDEAYLDYLEPAQQPDLVSLVRGGSNVIVLRTLSKVHGLAGLRIGYAIGAPALVTKLRALQWGAPTSNAPGIAAAMVTLGDTAHVAAERKRNADELARTKAALRSLGYQPSASVANHLQFPIRMDATRFRTALADRGYAVVASREADGDICRLSLGTREQMTGFAGALKAVG